MSRIAASKQSLYLTNQIFVDTVTLLIRANCPTHPSLGQRPRKWSRENREG